MEAVKEKIALAAMRWPFLAPFITLDMALDYDVTGDTPAPVLVYQSKHMSSAIDPRTEASVQASVIPVECKEAWVYGVGSGLVIEQLLQRPIIECLNVVVFNRQLLAKSLAVYEHTWLSDQRVNIFYAGDLSLPGKPFAAVYPELQLAEVAAHPLRDRVMTELDHRLRSQNLARRQMAYDQPNLKKNEIFIRQDDDIRKFEGAYKGGCVTVIAGGPTSSEFLAQPVASDCLVVVSTALKAVLLAGLRPDFVIAIDSHPDMISHFDSVVDHSLLQNTTLLYAPTVTPSILSAWSGPRAVFYLESPLFDHLVKEIPHTKLFCSGTVTHSAVAFTALLGASEVRLAGVDFGFPGGITHGENMNGHLIKDSQAEVVNGRGEMIASTPALIGYLRDLEQYIKQFPNICFLNMSARGAKIHGVDFFYAR